ncbi:hypothetical protein DCC81_24825 [Chitinophaga parva]|uniref:Uncharacterized protein n=1 Tax=Chitinophaga parva TaxID=2169414 RepID=A0A2T7BBP4_9BACT|nr:hypothetical protein [Chitinophaga parva]PUZ21815.1 hypothetical protein DCC81_24825 [Chitinophaga parva]
MDDHFLPTYKIITWTTAAVLLYIFCITFIPIPKDNVRFADTAEGFLLGSVVGAGFAWLVGGTPGAKKGSPAGSTATDLNATQTEKEDGNSQVG